MPVREYARALGVVLLLVGLGELVLAEPLMLAFLDVHLSKGVAYLLTGGLLAYLGFGQTDEGLARIAVGAFGGVFLLVGLLGFVLPPLLGLAGRGYGVLDNIIHLLIGVLSLAVAFASGRDPASRA